MLCLAFRIMASVKRRVCHIVVTLFSEASVHSHSTAVPIGPDRCRYKELWHTLVGNIRQAKHFLPVLLMRHMLVFAQDQSLSAS
jgi:hypothetical protein